MDASDEDIIENCGLDAFLFLRYLKMLLRIFVPLAIIVLPVLTSVNLHGSSSDNNATGLDRLSWANVDAEHTERYWIHFCLSLLVVSWVCRVVWFEMRTFLRLRQRRMAAETQRAFGTTVLVTDIPQDQLTVPKLCETYSKFPGGVRRVRINRNYDELKAKIEHRNKWVSKLEEVETRFIVEGMKADREVERGPLEKLRRSSARRREQCRLPILNVSWCPELPFLGQRVDLIDHCRKRVTALNDEIETDRTKARTAAFRKHASALIEFNSVHGAHLACQSISHPTPHMMQPKLVEVTSEHVIWRNVSFLWWQRYVRTTFASCLVASFCLACMVPVAFTGILSQLNYLATLWPWLAWLQQVPDWMQGVLQGVLPPALLTVLTLCTPILLERLIIEQTIHTDTRVELILQDYFFDFLFIQIFLVVSVSSSVAAVLSGATNGAKSVAGLLAQNLPKASNYFLSYILLQGLSVSAGSLLQIGQLCRIILGRLIDRTPRQIWERGRNWEVKWGTYFPVYTNIAVIGLIYSIVTPLILPVSAFSFLLLLLVQRYVILNHARFRSDTGGMVFPKAINQLFVGLYAMEVYLSGLFFMVRDERGRPACLGQGILMVVMLGCTVVYQMLINAAYRPLFRSLPMIDLEPHGRDGPRPRAAALGPLGRWFSQTVGMLEIVDNFRGETPATPHGIRLVKGPLDVKETTESEMKDFALQSAQPVVWIPKDPLGISASEIEQTRKASANSILISDTGASVDTVGRISCSEPPPEMRL